MREDIEQNLIGIMDGDEITKLSCLNRLGDIIEFSNLIVDEYEYIAAALIESIIYPGIKSTRGEMFYVLEKVFQKCSSIDPNIDKLINDFEFEDDAFIANTILLFPRVGKKSYIPIVQEYLNHKNPFIAKIAAYVLKYLKP